MYRYEKAHPHEKIENCCIILPAFIMSLVMADEKEKKYKMSILWGQVYSVEQKVRQTSRVALQYTSEAHLSE